MYSTATMFFVRTYLIPLAILLTLFGLVSAGCANRVYFSEREKLVCKEPFVPCNPGTFAETTIDTTSGLDFFLKIERVEGLNTDIDEFGVAFTAAGKGQEALMTVRDPADRLLQVTIYPVYKSTLQTPVTLNQHSVAYGSPAAPVRRDSILLSTRSPGSVVGDYDIRIASLSGTEARMQYTSNFSTVFYWDAQPTFTPDGNTAYFASDRKKGFGASDLYVSRRRPDGTWGNPINLGPGVNTPCDELSPFVDASGKWLYFSSAGHQTVGGYDLFRAPIIGGQLGKVENIGKPVNTPADELFPSAPPGANPDTLLYYSSNQAGSNGFDVYVLYPVRLKDVTLAGLQAQMIKLRGIIRNSQGTPVDSALVTLDERDPPRRVDSTLTNASGEYEFEIQEGKKYDVTANSKGTLYGSEEVLIPPYNSRTVTTKDVVLPDTIVFRVNFPFNNATDPYEFTLDDRGLPTDRRWRDIIDQAANALQRMQVGPGQVIELIGHTDPIGSDAFNMDLGRRRAEFVKRELVKRGVRATSLMVKTAGESQPLPLYLDEADELYRSRLRRVELIRRGE